MFSVASLVKRVSYRDMNIQICEAVRLHFSVCTASEQAVLHEKHICSFSFVHLMEVK